jgi:hypothetical protein
MTLDARETSLGLQFDPPAIYLRGGAVLQYKVRELVASFASVDERSLMEQLSLHLPRLSVDALNDPHIVAEEAGRQAARLDSLRRPWLDHVPLAAVEDDEDVRLCAVEPVEEEIARPILERFHYLLSFRSNSTHFGMRLRKDDPWPAVLMSVSPFDLCNVAPTLEGLGIPVSGVVVLSRMFAFPSAPRNSLSFMLARIRKVFGTTLRTAPAWITYVNENIGFNGASYRADNWHLIGHEEKVRYLYVGGNYVTDRAARQLYGSGYNDLIGSVQCPEFSQSRHDLRPLSLWLRASHGSHRESQSHIERWIPPT